NIINKGNNSVLDYGTTDYLGNARIVDNIIDFGAIEYTKAIGTSVTERHLSKLLTIYPVPAKNTLQLKNLNADKISQIQIIDIYGRQIQANYQGTDALLQVDISNVVSGNYFLKVLFANGKAATKPFTVL